MPFTTEKNATKMNSKVQAPGYIVSAESRLWCSFSSVGRDKIIGYLVTNRILHFKTLAADRDFRQLTRFAAYTPFASSLVHSTKQAAGDVGGTLCQSEMYHFSAEGTAILTLLKAACLRAPLIYIYYELIHSDLHTNSFEENRITRSFVLIRSPIGST